jgi:hypothetical protein
MLTQVRHLYGHSCSCRFPLAGMVTDMLHSFFLNLYVLLYNQLIESVPRILSDVRDGQCSNRSSHFALQDNQPAHGGDNDEQEC